MRWWGLAAVGFACAACSSRAPEATVSPSTRDAGVDASTEPEGQRVIFPWGDLFVRSKLDAAGRVQEVAFVFPVRTGVPLPTDLPVGGGEALRVSIDTPDVVAQQTIFASLAFYYTPHGFKPLGVYDTPLWDVHSSIRKEVDVQAIDCTDTTLPPVAILPPTWTYSPSSNCVPAMGIHAVDSAAPEYNKERFTVSQMMTFYAGKYNGHVLLVAKATMSNAPTGTYRVPVVPIPERPGVLTPTTLDVTSDVKRDTVTFTYKDFIPAPL
jgi:hypothetical protein